MASPHATTLSFTSPLITCRGFKATKQAIKVEYKLGKYDDVGQAYHLFCSCLISEHRPLETIKSFSHMSNPL
jgi:hypothetical protein